MKCFCICLFFSFNFLLARSQSFTGAGGEIPDNGSAATCFPITVTGIGNINSSYGLTSVCLNIKHSWDADLEIKLKAPDGTIVALSLSNGNGDDDYINTCFTSTATTAIANGVAPFTGNFLPQGNLGTMNNGQNADGIWYLCIKDMQASDTGHLINFSVNFNNNPAVPPAGCTVNQAAGNTCSLATIICNYSPYCGNTSAAYNTNTWPQLTAGHCGGAIINNSFFKFAASASTAIFNIVVNKSSLDNGIKLMIYHGGCGGAITLDICNTMVVPGLPTLITATGLTQGNTYYIMIDGYAGDICDYVLLPVNGISVSAPPPPVVTGPVYFCQGGSSAALSNVANGQDLLWYNDSTGGVGNTVAPIPSTAVVGSDTFWVSQSTGCGESIRKPIIVIILANPYAIITSNDTAICWGTSIPLNFTGSPYSIFTYSINGAILHTSTFGANGMLTEPTGNLFATTVYKLGNIGLINYPGCYQNLDDSLVVRVFPKPAATIKYTDSIACSVSNPTLLVTLSGTTGGVFSAIPAGLHINASTGEITPYLSSPATYTVVYTFHGAGACAQVMSTASARVDIVSPSQHVWIGAVSSAWENSANWSCGNIPDGTSDVILNQGNVVISSNVTINSLTVNPNVIVTVSSGYHLTVLH